MKNNKKSFVMYTEYQDNINMLSQEQKGDLLDCIFNFAKGVDNKPDGIVGMAFSFIRNQMQRDIEKYEIFINKQQENGRKGGRPKLKNPKNPTVNKKTHSNPKKPTLTQKSLDVDDDVYVYEDVNVYDYVDDDVILHWNAIAKKYNLAIIQKLTESRKSHLTARLREYNISSVEFISSLDKAISESGLLMGMNNKGWKASFDWFLNPSNYLKTIEGNYKQNKQTTKKSQSINLDW